MKKWLPIVIASSVVILVASCRNQPARPSFFFIQRADSLIATMTNFSGVVLVAEGGTPVFYKAYGFKNFDTGEPMDTASIFELASLSKPFTAMVLMMLARQGLLRYDDSLKNYVPEIPYSGITLRHLLTHTSGLPDYQAVMDANWDKSKIATNSDNIRLLAQLRPPAVFAPGTQYRYSNTGYMLLATVAERVAQKDFGALSEELIFEPLKMTHTAIRSIEDKVMLPQMAWGHIYVADQQRYVRADSFPQFNYTLWLGKRYGPGRVSATAGDLLTWDRALYSDWAPKDLAREAFAPARLTNGEQVNYGFGWRIDKTAAGTIVSHSGDNPGYKTYMARFIDVDKTLIVLCNNAHRDFETLTNFLQEQIVHQSLEASP
jgi:CubicO group peptidase (beta-lactamase class C family)